MSGIEMKRPNADQQTLGDLRNEDLAIGHRQVVAVVLVLVQRADSSTDRNAVV